MSANTTKKHKAQKPWHRGINPSKASTNPERVISAKGKSSLRTKATINRLNMYKDRPVRNRTGQIVHQTYQSKDLPTTRIEPNRKWFGKYYNIFVLLCQYMLLFIYVSQFLCVIYNYAQFMLATICSTPYMYSTIQGNTRVIGQKQLSNFVEEMSKTVANPYQFVLRQRKLPMALLTDTAKVQHLILNTRSYFSKLTIVHLSR